jgi:hypothetical protein
VKKQPSGWFVDKMTKELIIVMKKKEETDAQALARVGAAHGILDSDVHAGPPPVGNPEPITGWLIDVPDRPARPEGQSDFRREPREQEDPSGAVTRYNQRITASEGHPSLQPPIASILLGNNAPMLGARPAPETRSTPEQEQKR